MTFLFMCVCVCVSVCVSARAFVHACARKCNVQGIQYISFLRFYGQFC